MSGGGASQGLMIPPEPTLESGNIGTLLVERSKERGDQVALIWKGRPFSYREIGEEIELVAGRVLALEL